MKKKVIIIVAFLMLLAGGGVFFYPELSYIYYRTMAVSDIKSYQNGSRSIPEAEADEMIKKAEAFNSRLSGTLSTDPFLTGEVNPYENDAEYNTLLNINGVMGYIDVPGIDVYLPVYHGTSPTVLKKGAGHLYGSALPVGGSGTHSVISAHRGLPSAELFSRLDQLKKGDIFYYHIFDKILAYQVDKIATVEPTELELLDPVDGKEYMTLFTCTPYGINSHRLLVRGVRIPYEVRSAIDTAEQVSVNGPIMTVSLPPSVKVFITCIAGIVILLLLVIAHVWKHREEKGEKKRGK